MMFRQRSILVSAVIAAMLAVPNADPATARPSSGASHTTRLVAYGAGDARLELHRQLVANAAGVSADTPRCWHNVQILSYAYPGSPARFVSAELGWSGNDKGILRLRPNQASVGDWEKFGVCRDASSHITSIFTMAQGVPWVSAEMGWSGNDKGTLRARAQSFGLWEKYYTKSAPSDPEGSHNNYTWISAYSTNQYVSAEVGRTGTKQGILRARASSLGPWETFYW